MKNYALTGYILGVIAGLSFWFRISHGGHPWYVWFFGTILVALLIVGPVGALIGMLTGFIGELDLKRLRAKRKLQQ